MEDLTGTLPKIQLVFFVQFLEEKMLARTPAGVCKEIPGYIPKTTAVDILKTKNLVGISSKILGKTIQRNFCMIV